MGLNCANETKQELGNGEDKREARHFESNLKLVKEGLAGLEHAHGLLWCVHAYHRFKYIGGIRIQCCGCVFANDLQFLWLFASTLQSSIFTPPTKLFPEF